MDHTIKVFSLVKGHLMTVIHHRSHNGLAFYLKKCFDNLDKGKKVDSLSIKLTNEPYKIISRSSHSIVKLDYRNKKLPELLYSSYNSKQFLVFCIDLLIDLNNIAISMDFKYLFILVNGESIFIIDLETKQKEYEIDAKGIYSFDITTCGDYIVVSYSDRSIKVFKNPLIG